MAQYAESLGYDLVTVQDHPYQPAFYDTWTLITYLAAQTKRVTFVPTVASLPLRPPAMLAKSAATLDLLSAGGPSSGSAQAPSGTPSSPWTGHVVRRRKRSRQGLPQSESWFRARDACRLSPARCMQLMCWVTKERS